MKLSKWFYFALAFFCVILGVFIYSFNSSTDLTKAKEDVDGIIAELEAAKKELRELKAKNAREKETQNSEIKTQNDEKSIEDEENNQGETGRDTKNDLSQITEKLGITEDALNADQEEGQNSEIKTQNEEKSAEDKQEPVNNEAKNNKKGSFKIEVLDNTCETDLIPKKFRDILWDERKGKSCDYPITKFYSDSGYLYMYEQTNVSKDEPMMNQNRGLKVKFEKKGDRIKLEKACWKKMMKLFWPGFTETKRRIKVKRESMASVSKYIKKENKGFHKMPQLTIMQFSYIRKDRKLNAHIYYQRGRRKIHLSCPFPDDVALGQIRYVLAMRAFKLAAQK